MSQENQHLEEIAASISGEKASNFEVYDEGEIGLGHGSSIHRLRVEQEGEESFYVVHKILHSPGDNARKKHKAKEVHERLLSLPNADEYVIPILEVTKDGFLMTDLSEGGKNVVMATNDPFEKISNEVREISKSNDSFVPNFLKKIDILEETWKDDFEQKAELIAKETAEGNIQLQGDSTFFVLLPEGNYKLVVTDLDNTTIQSQKSADSLYDHNLDVIKDLTKYIELLYLRLDSGKY